MIHSFQRTAISIVLLAVVAGARGQVLYLMGVPQAPNEAQADAITRSFIEVMLKAEAGDRIRVFDAQAQRPIADIRVPDARTDRARLRLVSGQVARVPAFFKANRRDGSDTDPRVHLPNLLNTIATLADDQASEIRVLLCGSMFFGDGTDARFDFGAGTYPSDGHILATRALSPFGTADLRKLENTRLDILNLTPITDDRDRHQIQRFWTVYAEERGVTLTSWQTDAKLSVEMLLKEIKSPHMEVSIDRRDLRREIRRVSDPALQPNTWLVIACVDASASMDVAFAEIRRALADFATRLYDAGAEIHLAIIPFREEPLTALPFTPVRSEGNDGGKSLYPINQYLDGVSVRSALADPDAAIRHALILAETSTLRATHTGLLVIGDTGSETDPSPERARQLLADLTAWRDADTGRSVHAVYLGADNNPRRGFFEDLAAISNQPVATTFQTVADRIVERAAKVTTGLRPD